MATTEKIFTQEGGTGYAHWATEATLERLVSSLSKQGVSQADVNSLLKEVGNLNDNGKVDTAALRAVLSNLRAGNAQEKESDKDDRDHQKKQEGFWEHQNRQGRQTAKAFKDSNIKDQLKNAGDMFIMPVDTISDAFIKVSGVVNALGTGIANFTKSAIDKLFFFSSKLAWLGKSIVGVIGFFGGLATTIVGGLLGIIEQLGDSFFELYDTGINFAQGLGDGESGLGALALAAANARLTVGEFAEFISENARVAVAIGADAMGALSNSVRSALYPLGNLGLTAAETNEHLGEYLEMQRTLGVLDVMTRAQQARASSDYLIQLTLLAQITGKRRKQIAADMRTAMDQTALTTWMLNMGEQERKQAMKNVQAVTGVLATLSPEAANAFTEGLGRGSMNLTDWGKTMIKAGFTTEMAAQNELIRKIDAGDITEAAAQQEMLRIQRMMRANGPAIHQLHRMAVAGHSAAGAAADHLKALQGADLSLAKWRIELDKTSGTIGSWDEMQRSVSQTWTKFIAGLFNNDTFSKAMGTLAADLGEFLKPDGPFALGVADLAEKTGPALIEWLGKLKDAMPSVVTWFKELPGTLETLWIALKGGISYLRDMFFEQVAVGPHTDVWQLRSGSEIWAQVAKGLGDGLDASKAAIVSIMTATFSSIGTMLINAMTLELKSWPNKFLNLFGLGDKDPVGADGESIDAEFGTGGKTVAVAATAVTAEVIRRKLKQKAALAAVATAEKEAFEKMMKKVGVKFAARYGGLVALGPWAGIAGAAWLVYDMGVGAMDGLKDEANILEKKAGETKTAMEKFKTAAAGALAMGLFDPKVVYENVINRSFMTNPAFLGGDHPDTNGRRAGIMNEAVGALWNMLTGMEDFSGGGFNHNLGTLIYGQPKKEGEGTVLLPTETLAQDTQMSADEARKVVADILSQIDVEGRTIQTYTDKLQLLREQAELFSKPAGATVALSMFNAAVLRMSNPDITQGMLTVKNDILGLMRAISDPSFHRGTIALDTMTNTLGKLDDNVNDWSASELASFKSITESMGNFANQANSSNSAHKEVLIEIRDATQAVKRNQESQMNGDLWNSKQVIKAIKNNSEFAN